MCVLIIPTTTLFVYFYISHYHHYFTFHNYIFVVYIYMDLDTQHLSKTQIGYVFQWFIIVAFYVNVQTTSVGFVKAYACDSV